MMCVIFSFSDVLLVLIFLSTHHAEAGFPQKSTIFVHYCLLGTCLNILSSISNHVIKMLLDF